MNLDTISDIINELKTFETKINVSLDNQVYAKTIEAIENYIHLLEIKRPEVVTTATEIKNFITSAFDEYFKGNIKHATSLIEKIVTDYNDKLYVHNLHFANHKSINIYPNVNMYLFKGRCADWTKELTREDMLHIPSNKRNLVATQRFSMPGIPCLYLGQSIYVVWEELNRPQIDNLFVSRYAINNEAEFLDLGISIFDLEEIVSQLKVANKKSETAVNIMDVITDELLNKILITLILKIACHVTVKEPKKAFKSEYIIPQLLLVAIMNNSHLYGIRYSSTKVKEDSYIFANYAIPAINIESNKLYDSRIVNQTQLTQPINLGILDKTNIRTGLRHTDNFYRDLAPFKVNSNLIIDYSSTKLYDYELKICNNEGMFALDNADSL